MNEYELGLLIRSIFGLILAVAVVVDIKYKTLNKNRNPIFWGIVTFCFPIIAVLIYRSKRLDYRENKTIRISDLKNLKR